MLNGAGTDSPNENKRTARTNSEAIFRLFINFDIVSKVFIYYKYVQNTRNLVIII